MKVRVTVLCRDGAGRIEDCLDGLSRQILPDGSIEIRVLDNGSRDGSADLLERLAAQGRWPTADFTRSERNLGFSAGHNALLEAPGGWDYAVLANQDIRLPRPDAIARLIAASRGLGDRALIQPLIRDFSGRSASAGLTVAYTGSAAPSPGIPVLGPGAAAAPVDAVHGAFLLFSRGVFDEVGRLEELYFAYHEDVEYSMRARLRGIGSYCAPQAEIEHDQPLGGFRADKTGQYLMERNRWYYLLSYFSWPLLAALLPALLVQEAAMLYYFWENGAIAGKWRGYREVASHWGDLMRLRAAARARLAASTRREEFYLAHRPHIDASRLLDDPESSTAARIGVRALGIFHGGYYWIYRLCLALGAR